MSQVREKLIEATFEEVFTSGYNAASLANILNKAEVKKGAMYHYFPSKKQMVLAMIEEKHLLRIEEKWKLLINESKDVISVLVSILHDTKSWDLKNGYAFGNLLQEPLEHDEEFANLLMSVLDNWKNLFINALEKEKDQINQNINTKQCSTFIIATLEGAILLSKKSEDTEDFEDCMVKVTNYLNTLKN
jgi:TetR/AcrR family transcriptional repressor of nem operon